MDDKMQDYLKIVAIKTKIENFKEFDKTEEETIETLMKTFKLSYKDAVSMVNKFWHSDPFLSSEVSSSSLTERYEFLIQEKEKRIKEYDLAIQIVKDAINGYSVETIAKQKGLSIEKIKEILY